MSSKDSNTKLKDDFHRKLVESTVRYQNRRIEPLVCHDGLDPRYYTLEEIANRVREAKKEGPIGLFKYLLEQQKGKTDAKRDS